MAEDLGLERRDPVSAGDVGQPFEQARPHALSLERVLDGEGDLRAVGVCRKTKVVGDRDEPAGGGLGDERELVVVVDAAESRGLLGVDLRKREESEIETVGGEPAVEGEQGGGVVRPDGPQTQGRARPEDDVPLFFPRVGGFSDGDRLVCFRHETSV